MKISEDKREVGGWWVWMLALLVVSIVVLSVLGYAGKFTGTVVERAVFENSFQYSEARKAEVAVFTAQLAEINNTLQMDSTLTEGERVGLNSQAAAIRVQLAAAKSKQ